tara:strand:+ start:1212 stop:2234 length:1023 start_codon:yes stop_codon:yes gene_type:complete
MQEQIAQTAIGICEVPDKELFFGRALRRRIFRCASFKNTVIEEIANIDTGGKTLKNKARSGGLIIEKLKELTGEFIKGIRYDEPLPIIVKWNGVYFLIDGFHRVYVLKDLGQISWAFDYYEINKGYDIEDLYDEIGLGANNHPPSSKATRKDFLNRAIKWSKRVNREVTKEQLIEWIDGIEHTFTDKVVENIANDVLHARHIDRTFVSFTDDDAAKYLRDDAGKYTSDGEIDEQGFAGRLIRAEANGTYGPRNFTHILKDAKKGKISKVHVYIPSNKVKKEGSDPLKSVEDLKKELNEFWDCVKAMHYKLEADSNYCPFEFGVRPTQILEIDPDGGVVEL